MCILAVLRNLSRRYPIVLVDNRDELDRATSSLQLNSIPLSSLLTLVNRAVSAAAGGSGSTPVVRLSELVRVLGVKDGDGVTISAIDLAKSGSGTWMGACCVPGGPGGVRPKLRLACLTNCYQCASHALPYDVLKDNSDITPDGSRIAFTPHESRGCIVDRYLDGGHLPPNIYNVGESDPDAVASDNQHPPLYDGYSCVYGDVTSGPLRFTTNRLLVRDGENDKATPLSSPSWRAAALSTTDGSAPTPSSSSGQDYRAQPSMPLYGPHVGSELQINVLANTALNNDIEPKNVELRKSIRTVAEALQAKSECNEASASFVQDVLVPSLIAPMCTTEGHTVPPEVASSLFVKSRWTGLPPSDFERLVGEKVGSVDAATPIVALERTIQKITHAEQHELHKNVYTNISEVHPATGALVTFKTRMQSVVVVEQVEEAGGFGSESGLRLHYYYRTTNGPADHGPWEAIAIDLDSPDDSILSD